MAVNDPHFDVKEFVRRVLAEDLGSGGDITSSATISTEARFTSAGHFGRISDSRTSGAILV